MCGRFIVNLLASDLERWFDATVEEPWLPLYNAAPAEEVPVIRENPATGTRHVQPARWGLVPHGGRGPDGGPVLFNARRETVGERPAFAAAFARRPAVVPASAFAEWSRIGTRKQPWRLQTADGAPLWMAALWERWRGTDDRWLLSTTVLTQPALGVVAELHDRMPLLLPREVARRWLVSALDADERQELLRTPPPLLVAAPLAPAFGDARRKDAAIAEPTGPWTAVGAAAALTGAGGAVGGAA